jgi:hypothetical protein
MKIRFLVIIGIICVIAIGILLYQQSQEFRYPPPNTYPPDTNPQTNPSGQLIPANSWDDYDKFAQDIVNAAHDTIIEKRSDDANQAIYTTQKGNLVIRKNNLDDYSVMVDYSLDGTKIPKSDADSFVDSFMKNINYQMDRTEKIDRTDYGTYYRIAISQKNHGWIIQNQMAQFEFWKDSSTIYIRLGKWYNNLPQIELKTSQDEAKKIAFDYLTSEARKDPKLSQQIGKSEWVQMEVVNDRLVYVVAGSGFPLNVLVDPVSGNVVGLKQPMRMD